MPPPEAAANGPLEPALARERQLNMRLLSTIQNIKGDVLACVRIRPESGSGSDELEELSGNTVLIRNSERSDVKLFKFDYCFDRRATNGSVFFCLEHLATSLLEGFNIAVIAYGQTGSGKTHTMLGDQKDPGLCMQLVEKVIKLLSLPEFVDSVVNFQMIEIYNEDIFDLLSRSSTKIKQEIQMVNEMITLPNLATKRIRSIRDFVHFLRLGQGKRSTASTQCNSDSSRSHCVMTVTVEYTRFDNNVIRGKLNLVDLAGSERVDRSQSTGDRLVEAQYINKSISALGDVMQALDQKNPHIPYRNSRLTLYLKDCLCLHAKVIMLFTVRPVQPYISESTSTLTYASRLRHIRLGCARKQFINKDYFEECKSLQQKLSKSEGDLENLHSKLNELVTAREEVLKRQQEEETVLRQQEEARLERIRGENADLRDTLNELRESLARRAEEERRRRDEDECRLIDQRSRLECDLEVLRHQMDEETSAFLSSQSSLQRRMSFLQHERAAPAVVDVISIISPQGPRESSLGAVSTFQSIPPPPPMKTNAAPPPTVVQAQLQPLLPNRRLPAPRTPRTLRSINRPTPVDSYAVTNALSSNPSVLNSPPLPSARTAHLLPYRVRKATFTPSSTASGLLRLPRSGATQNNAASGAGRQHSQSINERIANCSLLTQSMNLSLGPGVSSDSILDLLIPTPDQVLALIRKPQRRSPLSPSRRAAAAGPTKTGKKSLSITNATHPSPSCTSSVLFSSATSATAASFVRLAARTQSTRQVAEASHNHRTSAIPVLRCRGPSVATSIRPTLRVTRSGLSAATLLRGSEGPVARSVRDEEEEKGADDSKGNDAEVNASLIPQFHPGKSSRPAVFRSALQHPLLPAAPSPRNPAANSMGDVAPSVIAAAAAAATRVAAAASRARRGSPTKAALVQRSRATPSIAPVERATHLFGRSSVSLKKSQSKTKPKAKPRRKPNVKPKERVVRRTKTKAHITPVRAPEARKEESASHRLSLSRLPMAAPLVDAKRRADAKMARTASQRWMDAHEKSRSRRPTELRQSHLAASLRPPLPRAPAAAAAPSSRVSRLPSPRMKCEQFHPPKGGRKRSGMAQRAAKDPPSENHCASFVYQFRRQSIPMAEIFRAISRDNF